MAAEGWIDPQSHYIAHGEVVDGKMDKGSVTDNNGLHLGNMSFSSKEAFYTWARKRSGMSS